LEQILLRLKPEALKKDFTNFFSYALKSANESKFWLGLLRDSGKTNKDRTNKLLQETTEISNILASSILTLKGKKSFNFLVVILRFSFYALH